MGYPRSLVQERSLFYFHTREAGRQTAQVLPRSPCCTPFSLPALPSKLIYSPCACPSPNQARDEELEEGPTFLSRPFSCKRDEEMWEVYTDTIKEPMWTQVRGGTGRWD